MIITISPPNPLWASQFLSIRADLAADLSRHGAPYLTIEHVGSTSIPQLCAKPILDILIVIASAADFPAVLHALIWGERQGGYRLIGDGGVQGRWSFKLNGVRPERNLYVVVQGTRVWRSYLDLRETLRRDQALREEYAAVKRELAARGDVWGDVMEYASAKDAVVRKVLKSAGWTDEEVDLKEAGAVKGWGDVVGEY